MVLPARRRTRAAHQVEEIAAHLDTEIAAASRSPDVKCDASSRLGAGSCPPVFGMRHEGRAPMPRFKLLIEYAGTRYSGWQIQKNARTVQGEIERGHRDVTGARALRVLRLRPHRRGRPRARAGGAPRRSGRALPPESLASADQRRAARRHQHPARRQGAAPLSRAARRRVAQLRVPDRAAPHGVRASRSSGGSRSRSTSPRCARAPRAFDRPARLPSDSQTTTRTRSPPIVEIGDASRSTKTETRCSSASRARTSCGSWCGGWSACSWRLARARSRRPTSRGCSTSRRACRRR